MVCRSGGWRRRQERWQYHYDLEQEEGPPGLWPRSGAQTARLRGTHLGRNPVRVPSGLRKRWKRWPLPQGRGSGKVWRENPAHDAQPVTG